MKGVRVVGKLLKRIPNSSKEILNKRIQSLDNSDIGVYDYGSGVYNVYNFDSKQYYNVIYTDKNVECDCVDYSRHCEGLGLPCKHILAVKRFKESKPDKISKGFEKFLKSIDTGEELFCF